MKQLNLNVTEEFERDLRRFMRRRGIAKKSEAVRLALHEATLRESPKVDYDFRSWLGMALKGPLNPKPRFKSEDDLWS
jgi:hypothetical protein